MYNFSPPFFADELDSAQQGKTKKEKQNKKQKTKQNKQTKHSHIIKYTFYRRDLSFYFHIKHLNHSTVAITGFCLMRT